jgi:hypothetical protein
MLPENGDNIKVLKSIFFYVYNAAINVISCQTGWLSRWYLTRHYSVFWEALTAAQIVENLTPFTIQWETKAAMDSLILVGTGSIWALVLSDSAAG